MSRFFFLTTFFLCCLANAHAQDSLPWGEKITMPSAPLNFPAPGTILIWKDLYTGSEDEERVVAPIGRLYQSVFLGQRRYGYLPDPWADNENTDPDDMAGLFPLEVGKKVSFPRKPEAGRMEDKVEVLDTVRIQVPAGTFDTFILKTQSKLVAGGWTGEATYWYAPSIPGMVQYEIKDSDGVKRRRQLLKVIPPKL